MTFTREEHERRRAAYEAYSNDTDAARSLGVPAASMRYWREKNGLPTKSPHSLAPEEEQRRIGAYGKSSSDFEAAAQLGISQRTFTFWRRSRALPAKNEKVEALSESERQRRYRAYHETNGDTEAANTLGMPVGSYYAWRKREGLPARTNRWAPGQLSNDEVALRVHAYLECRNDAAAAAVVGIKKHGFKTWRHNMQLPGKEFANKLTNEEVEQRLQLIRQSATHDEAAKELNLAVHTLEKFLRVRGLAFRQREHGNEKARWTELLNQGQSPESIALEAGVNGVTVRKALGVREGLRQGRNPLRVGLHRTDPRLIAKALALAQNTSAGDAAQSLGITASAVLSWRQSFTAGSGRTQLLLAVARIMKHDREVAEKSSAMDELSAEIQRIAREAEQSIARAERRTKARRTSAN